MNTNDIPKHIARYQIIRELGRGIQCVTYQAHDPFHNRLVVLKTTKNPTVWVQRRMMELYESFYEQARRTASLKHSHIMELYDAFIEEHRCYLAYEFVEGVSVREYCSPKNLLGLNQVVKIVFHCAKALDFAHRYQCFHGNIKPVNIMLPNEDVTKIADFGTKPLYAITETHMDSELTGDFFYSAPEKISRKKFPGAEVDRTADIFALGIVLYELLTGVNPFMAESDDATKNRIINMIPHPLRFYRPEIPETLDGICRRALQKDPALRYQSALELAFELSNSFEHLGPVDHDINFEEKFNSLKRIPFFRHFSPDQLAEVIRSTQWLKYRKEDAIINEGEMGNCFFILLHGEVAVKKRGKVLATLKAGDCFGEMAYIGRTRRTASIKANTDAMLMKISDSVIESTSESTQLQFYRIFSKTLIKRLSTTSELLTKLSH